MSLAHKFVAVWSPLNKNVLYSEDVYENIKRGQIRKRAVLEIPDDVVQVVLYDAHGKLLPDIKFNQWGITVYESEELIQWIDFLKNISEKISNGNKRYCHTLYDFMQKSYNNNSIVLHFGI